MDEDISGIFQLIVILAVIVFVFYCIVLIAGILIIIAGTGGILWGSGTAIINYGRSFHKNMIQNNQT